MEIAVMSKLFANEDYASAFREGLKAFLENHGYKLDNIYNGDETSLFWKHFPTKTFVCRNETEAPGRKASKDRVTIQVCSNASGTHKIPLTFVGKSERPRCLKNVYVNCVQGTKKSWMDCNVFTDWYKNVFIPSVKKRNPDPEAK
ncbi:hypothetical protein NQ318_012770 [Aromia moschata]|uniref:DDE-1 domain-containing protein n=1 Tax=Aromia moschata TaxID=1265417 RepID=A0AAV8YJ64_9CUCU|nr:hypothetical protein NQ318_012770 [Aromia moschata]